MARFFKPLLGAVALAAAALTSTGAFAQSYNYNTQVTITAPKGSTAEAAAKNKALPTGVKYSTCAPRITQVTPNVQNIDTLSITVKYDAGKLTGELGDVFVVFQNLTEDPTLASRYFVVARSNPEAPFIGGGVTLVDGGPNVTALDATLSGGTGLPFLAAADNLGTGAQTEVLFGNSLNVTGLPKGLWAVNTVIAKPGATYEAATAETNSTFMFSRPETWAAHDTAIFELGTPFGISTAQPALAATNLVDYATNTGAQFCE